MRVGARLPELAERIRQAKTQPDVLKLVSQFYADTYREGFNDAFNEGHRQGYQQCRDDQETQEEREL